MSVTETRIGLSPRLFEIFQCNTNLKEHRSGPLHVVLVLEQEVISDPMYWRRISDIYHTLTLSSLDRAVEAMEWYADKFSYAVGSVTPGVPTERLKHFKE